MLSGIKLTPSGIEVFEGCPYLFKLMHIERRRPTRERPSPQLALGNSVHDCLYEFHKNGGHGKYDPASMEALLKRCWISGGYRNADQEQASWEEALEMCRGYYEAFQDDPVEHLGSELFVDSTIRVDGTSVKLSGKFDRLSSWPDGRLEVVDYKTTSEPEPSPTKLAGKLTAFLYYLLARTRYKDPPKVVVSYIYLRTMRKVTAIYDPATGADCKARLTEAVRQIAAGEFPARPNQRCAWCDFTELCPTTGTGEVDLDDII